MENMLKENIQVLKETGFSPIVEVYILWDIYDVFKRNKGKKPSQVEIKKFEHISS